jgi:hypothetical protein
MLMTTKEAVCAAGIVEHARRQMIGVALRDRQCISDDCIAVANALAVVVDVGKPRAADRHPRIVDITPQGRKLAQAVFPEANAEQLKLLRALSPDERHVTGAQAMAVYGAKIPQPVVLCKDQSS